MTPIPYPAANPVMPTESPAAKCMFPLPVFSIFPFSSPPCLAPSPIQRVMLHRRRIHISNYEQRHYERIHRENPRHDSREERLAYHQLFVWHACNALACRAQLYLHDQVRPLSTHRRDRRAGSRRPICGAHTCELGERALQRRWRELSRQAGG
jgi:hypothetical protein